jgi:HPt (histidine-containing phosphotransfer) domain-containing protein
MSRVIISSGPVLDANAAMIRLGGDADLYSDLIEFYVVDAPALMQDLWQAVDKHDAAAVRMKAHALKGLIAGCGGVRAVNVAQMVESAAQSGDSDELPTLVQSLDAEIDSLTQLLLPHRRAGG